MSHQTIIIFIIICVGSFAGITNFLYYYFKGIISTKWEILKHISSGIGAAILVPLLLNMLSSDLIKETSNYDESNYLVFAGFCFVAGYFSDRFINSMGDKILKDIENTKDQVRKALVEVKENEEKLDLLVSNETDKSESLESEINIEDFKILNTFKDDALKIQLNNIVRSFKGEYKFRTATGISKELNYPDTIVKITLEELEKAGVTKKLMNKDNKVIWALTQIGQTLADKNKESDK
jgi:hypothetical protein